MWKQQRQDGAVVVNYAMQCMRCGSKVKHDIGGSHTVATWLPHKWVAQNCRVEELDWKIEDPRSGIDPCSSFSEPEDPQSWWRVYSEYLDSPEWKLKRQQVLEVDQGQCLSCKGKAEIVHHLNYHTVGDEDLGSLVSLCHDCHTRIHEEKDMLKKRRFA